jgi:hypothetical protein
MGIRGQNVESTPNRSVADIQIRELMGENLNQNHNPCTKNS